SPKAAVRTTRTRARRTTRTTATRTRARRTTRTTARTARTRARRTTTTATTRATKRTAARATRAMTSPPAAPTVSCPWPVALSVKWSPPPWPRSQPVAPASTSPVTARPQPTNTTAHLPTSPAEVFPRTRDQLVKTHGPASRCPGGGGAVRSRTSHSLEDVLKVLFSSRMLAFHALVLVVVPTFIWLGFWQLDRWEVRSAAVNLQQENIEAEHVPVEELAEVGSDVDPADRWRTVEATGTWD